MQVYKFLYRSAPVLLLPSFCKCYLLSVIGIPILVIGNWLCKYNLTVSIDRISIYWKNNCVNIDNVVLMILDETIHLVNTDI